jgi:hypothetical protein
MDTSVTLGVKSQTAHPVLIFPLLCHIKVPLSHPAIRKYTFYMLYLRSSLQLALRLQSSQMYTNISPEYWSSSIELNGISFQKTKHKFWICSTSLIIMYELHNTHKLNAYRTYYSFFNTHTQISAQNPENRYEKTLYYWDLTNSYMAVSIFITNDITEV